MQVSEMLAAVQSLRAALARFEGELKRQQALATAAASVPGAYQAPVEQWYVPAGEGCVAYGAADAAEPLDADAQR
jgi:hypothetical protein